MSSDDYLRASLRSALQFRRPEVSRDSDLSRPYLDKISVSQHMPTTSSTSHGNLPLLIQPISMPELSHTGLSSSFMPEDAPFMLPDGSASKELRRQIKERYAAVRREEEVDDSEDQDKEYDEYDEYEREEEKKQRKKRQPSNNKKRKRRRRKKKKAPLAGPPNFENFLDYVYGPSTISGEYRRNYQEQMRAYLPPEI